jgi:23S rRNA pseudouridine1911/1915/1917 synthase
MTELNIIIPNRLIGQRIDSAMAQLLPDYSRSKITQMVKAGYATLQNKTFKPKEKILGGEVINLKIEREKKYTWLPENIPIEVVYEDADIIVLNKPVGLVTHPGNGNASGTLANALLFYDESLKNIDRAGIVHRLDKNTSGLMVVARNALAQKNLSEQLQNHSVSREYNAIVYGHMISGGTVDAPIGRDPRDRIKQAVVEGGKNAVSHYRVVERFAHHTLVKVMLETGRTHQIRVHMSFVEYPLVADPTYGGKIRFPKKAQAPLKNALKGFARQALHARKLSLIHPITQEPMSWKVPLPQDLQDLLAVLREFDSL